MSEQARRWNQEQLDHVQERSDISSGSTMHRPAYSQQPEQRVVGDGRRLTVGDGLRFGLGFAAVMLVLGMLFAAMSVFLGWVASEMLIQQLQVPHVPEVLPGRKGIDNPYIPGGGWLSAL